MLYQSFQSFHSPIGELFVVQENGKISALFFNEEELRQYGHMPYDKENETLNEAINQLKEYFARKRKTFELPLKIEGTSFQLKVWAYLMTIPYGETRSYLDVAIAINNPKAVRAVGQANKGNKLPIFIPCHRVIGKNGQLVGYAGKEIGMKEKLLLLENAL